MLQSQLQNIARMIGQADQTIGKDALDRCNDLMKGLEAVQSELATLAAGTTA